MRKKAIKRQTDKNGRQKVADGRQKVADKKNLTIRGRQPKRVRAKKRQTKIVR